MYRIKYAISRLICLYYQLRYRLIYQRYAKVRIDQDTLYIHVPKTGGTAVCKALNIWPIGHHNVEQREKASGQANKLIIATRDPVSRFVSTWKYARKKSQRWPNAPLFFLRRYSDLNKLVASPVFDAFAKYHYFFRPQSYYLKGYDPDRHELVVIQQETLTEDVKNLLGIDIPVANRSPDIAVELSDASREKIERIYREDYERFYPDKIASDEKDKYGDVA